MVGFHRQTCQRQCLPKAFKTACILLGPEDVSCWKILLLYSAPVHTARTIQWLFVEFWTPAAWLPYSPDLNLLDFTIWGVLQAKFLAKPHAKSGRSTSIHRMEWNQLVAEYIRRLPLFLPLPVCCHLEK
jgi:hypothetical protein